MIEDVRIIPLKQIPDDRGKVMHMLRSDASWFDGFGEIYFSIVNPGAIKAWRLHKKMVLNYAVPMGKIRLVLYDDREGSKTRYQIQEVITGEEEYCLIKIPAFIWTGFQGLAKTRSIVANCSTLPHDPDEIVRLDFRDEKIPYKWKDLG